MELFDSVCACEYLKAFRALPPFRTPFIAFSNRKWEELPLFDRKRRAIRLKCADRVSNNCVNEILCV